MQNIENTSRNGFLVFLGNIGLGVAERDLHSLLEPLGAINYIRLARDQQTGYSLGYAFVEMRHEHEAVQAVWKLKETRIEKRQLIARAIF